MKFITGTLPGAANINSSDMLSVAKYVYNCSKGDSLFMYMVSCGQIVGAFGFMIKEKRYGVIYIISYVRETPMQRYVVHNGEVMLAQTL